MDEQVIAAMARWPNVPAVHGWLSLTEAGQWRLHPAGDALRQPISQGEAITSPQILAFIDRNYGVDAQGQWYFQNGPQRVYVRLDAAPFTAYTATDTATGRLKLRTHTGLDIRDITALYLDETGRLYAATDRGPALISGRDLPAMLDALEAAPTPPLEKAGTSPAQSSDADSHDTDIAELLVRCIETGETVMLRSRGLDGFPADLLPLFYCSQAALENTLNFRRRPVPEEEANRSAQPASGQPPGPAS